jgi:hypothetical protein
MLALIFIHQADISFYFRPNGLSGRPSWNCNAGTVPNVQKFYLAQIGNVDTQLLASQTLYGISRLPLFRLIAHRLCIATGNDAVKPMANPKILIKL